MIFDSVVVGQLGVNCFILGCEETREGVVIDPGADGDQVLALVAAHNIKVKYVINTHGHFDHVGANRQVLESTGAELLIHEGDVHYLPRAADVAAMYGLQADESPRPSRLLEDNMSIGFGSCSLKVLHTPGHTPGGCSLYLPSEGKVITGDTLFAESVGRTDLPGGSHPTLIASIRERLLTLPDDTVVFPGHGPSSTIGREKKYNPYLNGAA